VTHVTVSSKFQVVIPKEVRKQLPLKSGQRLAVIVKEGMITLLPERPLSTFKGFLKPMKVGAIREKQDRV